MTALGRAIRFPRGLRFRLAFSYGFFFTLLLVGLGLVFRQTLDSILQNEMLDQLKEEFASLKLYYRSDAPESWFYDRTDPDENFTVERLRRVYMVADTAGHTLQYSTIYESIGFDPPDEIKSILKSGQPAIRIRKDPKGVPYLIRSGLMVDVAGHNYYVAIGRAIDQNIKTVSDFTTNYFLVVSIVVVLSGIFGWFLAARALGPVNSVASTAQRITHSNLDMQIPLRGAGDELDRMIEAFNHMMTRLNASFEQIRQFSTDVSHELRTPLTVVRGQLEVALFTAKTIDQYRDAMAEALEGVDRLSNIVRALLMLSQAESGQLALQKTQLDFAELVREIVDQHQIPAEAQGVLLTADLPPTCTILADRVQIERLVSNLLGNAVKYTPSGGAVKVRITPDVHRVKFIVEDTGVGIAPDHLPHIFDRFYRVPSADPEKGLGLGLSFVAWIVRAHGGTVDVESKPGDGTTFTVSLPIGSIVPVTHESSAISLPEKVH